MNPDSLLYKPIKIGKFTFKNRFTVAPYGSGLHEPGGGVGTKLMAHMRNVARGGAAMATIGSGDIEKRVSPFAVAAPGNPALISDHINLAEMAHQYDMRISMQLFSGTPMMTPTEIVMETYTKDMIEEWRQNFVDAALNVRRAGFDFIMIHGAHGNGPSMFFSPAYNHRTDEYGGSFANRSRFALEVLDSIRDAVSDDLGIEYRISAEEMIEGGATLEETLDFAMLIQSRVDILHVSRCLLEEDSHLPYVFTPTYFERGINVPYAEKFHEALDVPVSVVGGVNLELAERIVDEGKADLVNAARNFIADPMCMTKAVRGQDDQIRPCIRCNVCINQTHAKLWDLRCSVNPLMGREVFFPTVGLKAGKSKKVVCVGGGPANLQLARTAAQRGHKVVLFERDAELGGKLTLATKTDFKKDLRNYLEWSVRTVLAEPNVEVRPGVEATPELVAAENADALVIAIGGDPIIPKFSASGTDKLIWVGDMEGRMNEFALGDDIVVAGGGLTGLEAALELSQAGKRVKVVDMIPESSLGKGGTPMNVIGLMKLLDEGGVEFICDTRIEDITAEGMTVIGPDGEKRTIECDNVILSFGIRKDPAKVEAFKGIVPETYVIGDCSSVGGTVWQATRSGFDIAMDL